MSKETRWCWDCRKTVVPSRISKRLGQPFILCPWGHQISEPETAQEKFLVSLNDGGPSVQQDDENDGMAGIAKRLGHVITEYELRLTEEEGEAERYVEYISKGLNQLRDPVYLDQLNRCMGRVREHRRALALLRWVRNGVGKPRTFGEAGQ